MSQDPKNPPITPGQKVPARGETRQTPQNGLEWFDSTIRQWRPAVRQHTIRDRLLQQATHAFGTYTHPRGQGDNDDRRAPLASDINDGGAWGNRPDRLFQLDAMPNQYTREPTTILLDGHRVILDPFDHPIRDFGNDLPVVLSSQMRGWEIENDMRKNLAIHYYDLIARCPDNPPYCATIRERATKFREASGSLAWESRPGSESIRRYILSLLPAGATTTRALGRDLTKDQLAARKATNAGQFSNRRRKTKREAEARAAAAENQHDERNHGDRVVTGRVYKQKRSQGPGRGPASDRSPDTYLSQDQDIQANPRAGEGALGNVYDYGFNPSQSTNAENFRESLGYRQHRSTEPVRGSYENTEGAVFDPYTQADPSGRVRRPSIDYNNIFKPEEHANYMARLHAPRASNLDANIQPRPASRNPRVLAGCASTSNDMAMTSARRNDLNLGDDVQHDGHTNYNQGQPSRRRRVRQNVYTEEDVSDEIISWPKVHKRARDDALEGDAIRGQGPVRDESLLGSSSDSHRGVRDESLLRTSSSSSGNARQAKRQKSDGSSKDKSTSEEDDYLNHTPSPEQIAERSRTISDSEPERKAARRAVQVISSDDDDQVYSSFASWENIDHRRRPYDGADGKENEGQAESSRAPVSQHSTIPPPTYGARRNPVQQASSYNMNAPRPGRGASSRTQSGGSLMRNSGGRIQSRANANPNPRSWFSTSAFGQSPNLPSAYNDVDPGLLPNASRREHHPPLNSLASRDGIFYDTSVPIQGSQVDLPGPVIDSTVGPSFDFPATSNASPLESSVPDGSQSFDVLLPESSPPLDPANDTNGLANVPVADESLPLEPPNPANGRLNDPIPEWNMHLDFADPFHGLSNMPIPDPNAPLDFLDPTVDLFNLPEPDLDTPLAVSPPHVIQDFNHRNDPGFAQEWRQGLARRDVRFYLPSSTSNDSGLLVEALRLTRHDYEQRLPGAYIPDASMWWGESYASQHRRLQEAVEMHWTGPGPTPMLYRLEQFMGSFEDWQDGIVDEEGRRLLRQVEETDARAAEEAEIEEWDNAYE